MRNGIRFPIMLDSGAYNAWRAGKEVDFREYMRYLKYLIEKYPSADLEYVNLDIIGDGKASYKNWRIMRDEGLNPIPVWHLTTSRKWLSEYLKLTDRLALSWFGAMPFKRRILSLDFLWGNYLTDENGMPTRRVHGMGVADFKILLRYPWYTVDSSSWLLTAAMGDVFVPEQVDGEWRFDRRPTRVTVSGPVMRWGHGNRVGLRLSSRDDDLVRSYFEYINAPLDGDEGMRNYWAPRRRANMRFYWEFVRRLKSPRPFIGTAPTGLWGSPASPTAEKPAISSGLFDHTVLFLAGNIEWEGRDRFLEDCVNFPGLGRLTSYWYTNTPDSKAKALENLLEAIWT